MNEIKINKLRETLKMAEIDPHICCRDISNCQHLIYFYTDIDSDDIRRYDFQSEKTLLSEILNNPTCLEPIDLHDLVSELQSEFDR